MLFKTTQELANYVRIDVNAKFASFDHFIASAEYEFIIPLLGKAQYNELNEAYNDTDPLSADLAALLPMVQRPLALYATFMSVPHMGVKVGDLGIQQNVSPNSQPAPAFKVNAVREDYLRAADTAADALLEWLELAAIIPDGGTEADRKYKLWYNSSARSSMSGCIVYKTSIASKYIDINDSRRLFLRLKKRIIDIEQGTIQRLICSAQYVDLLSKIATGTLTDDLKALVEHLEPIIAKRALAATLPLIPVVITADGLYLQSSNDSVIQKQQASDAEKARYLKELSDNPDSGYLADEIRLNSFITANIDKFPLIQSSACWSATQTVTRGNKWRADNHPENKHFSV